MRSAGPTPFSLRPCQQVHLTHRPSYERGEQTPGHPGRDAQVSRLCGSASNFLHVVLPLSITSRALQAFVKAGIMVFPQNPKVSVFWRDGCCYGRLRLLGRATAPSDQLGSVNTCGLNTPVIGCMVHGAFELLGFLV